MSIVRLQGDKEVQAGIYYEFDPMSNPLGEGGMGKVYRGRRVNQKTKEVRDVAIKFMYSALPESIIDRARREASIIIPHENLVEMMGFFTVNYTQNDGSSTPRYHVVSEFLQGVSLSDLLQGVVEDQYGNPVPYAKKLYALYNNDPKNFAVTVTKKLLSGIMALHDAGYIHRDIDPSNIMITTDGKIKLIDFGIAKLIDGLVTCDKNLTSAGQFMGKPRYAAPELVLGDIKSQNKETDIYAIGILMYQLITGHLPYEGSTIEVLSKHLRGEMPLKNIKDYKLRRIIGRATEKRINKRYHSAAEFRAALDAWTPGSELFDPKKIAMIVGIAFATVLVTIGAYYLATHHKKEQQPVVKDTRALSVEEKLMNTNTAEEGYAELKQKVEKKNIDYMFLYSQLYTRPYRTLGLDKDILTMQANLSEVISQDPATTHSMLKTILDMEPNYYPALYELARDYFVGPELTGGENQDLPKAKRLLDQALKHATEAKDPVYIGKIKGMLALY